MLCLGHLLEGLCSELTGRATLLEAQGQLLLR